MRKGSVSVAEFRPDLVGEWADRNDKKPTEVARGSYYKAWWVGTCGHEWQSSVDNRCYNNTGCPYCAKRGWKKLLPGENDLATRFPDIAKQWHPTRNGSATPQNTLPGVKEHVWWLCDSCGREWRAQLNTRTSRGTGCPSCRGRKRGLKVSGSAHRESLYSEWGDQNDLKLRDFSVNSRHKAHWVCEKGHSYYAAIGDRNSKRTECKTCGFGGSSSAEREVLEFVESLGVEVRGHHRQINPAFEYDITVPDRKLVIEYNGIYWHSEKFKVGSDYHLRKTRAAEAEGWTVLHVWEDDWTENREVVKDMISRKVGASKQRKLNARSLKVEQVDASEARNFLSKNHIQGFTVGTLYLSLKEGEEVVALLTMKKVKDAEYRLERFATSEIVRGAFSKLLKRSVEILGAKRIVTFSDNAVSSGDIYEAQGFTRDAELRPDYSYVVRNKREHKFNYRKARFRRDPNLKFEEGMSERELAQLNGLERIWDAGKVRWVLNV